MIQMKIQMIQKRYKKGTKRLSQRQRTACTLKHHFTSFYIDDFEYVDRISLCHPEAAAARADDEVA
jgi:hypothetical protein